MRRLCAKNPRPVWKTELWINRTRHGTKVLVLVFETRAGMLKAYRAFNRRLPHRLRHSVGRDVAGMASWHYWRIPIRSIDRRVRGIVWLCRPHSGVGVVSHELTHIASYHAERRDRESFTDWSERLAFVQGHLVHQYWRRFYRSPLAPETKK